MPLNRTFCGSHNGQCKENVKIGHKTDIFLIKFICLVSGTLFMWLVTPNFSRS